MEKVKQQIPFKKQQIHIFLLTLCSALLCLTQSIHCTPHRWRGFTIFEWNECATVLYFSAVYYFLSFARSFQFNFKLFCSVSESYRWLFAPFSRFLFYSWGFIKILFFAQCNRCRNGFAWRPTHYLQIETQHYRLGRPAICMMTMMAWLLIKNARTMGVYVVKRICCTNIE